MGSGKFKKFQVLTLTGFIVLLDQALKAFFLRFWPGAVTANRGVALGLFPSDLWIAASFLLIGVVFWMLFLRELGILGRLGLVMVGGGGFSNFVDRIIRGAVVDYIKIPLWLTTFNLADVFICLGISLVGYKFLFGKCNSPDGICDGHL